VKNRLPALRRWATLLGAGVLLWLGVGCRIESAAPGHGNRQAQASSQQAPSGELWVYTSMYRQVLDALEPLLRERMPDVRIHWYQAGSEKVSSRLEAERAAGGVRADVLLTSDPFLYERLRRQDALLRYASPYALRIPRSLVDPDAHWVSARLSTMVLVHREEETDVPRSFAALADPAFRGQVAVGDPLTSGTAFTWAVFLAERYGEAWFEALRANEVVVAGGNAAVLQKVESGEVKAGVLLLENALAAKERGSRLAVVWPEDGAVVIPGAVAIFAGTPNPAAARAFVDLLLSPEGQALIVERGDMHAVDPRLPGPGGLFPLEELLLRSQPWTEERLAAGMTRGSEIKQAFARAFSR
jgi:iron(III) transport system substrate-binding protein